MWVASAEEEYPLDDKVRPWIHPIITTSASISFIACALFLSGFFFLSSEHRTLFNRMVFQLVGAAGLSSLFWIISVFDPSCSIGPAGKLYFALVAFFWISNCSFLAALIVLSPSPAYQSPHFLEKYDLRSKLIAYLIPLIAVVASSAGDAFGKERFWCWITEEKLAYRYIFFSVPLFLALLFNGVIYILLRRHGKKFRSDTHQEKTTSKKIIQVANNIRSLILVFLFCWIWSFLDDVIDSADPKVSVYVLIPDSIISPLYGVATCFVMFRYVPLWRLIKSSRESANKQHERDEEKSQTIQSAKSKSQSQAMNPTKEGNAPDPGEDNERKQLDGPSETLTIFSSNEQSSTTTLVQYSIEQELTRLNLPTPSSRGPAQEQEESAHLPALAEKVHEEQEREWSVVH